MQWSDFGPFVQPYVIGCPDPVLTHHVRLAAMEFCRKTLCWMKRLEEIRTDGSSIVEIEAEIGALIVKVKSVTVNGKDWPLVDATTGLTNLSNESSDKFCFTEDGKTLNIYPIQPAGSIVIVRAAMAPTVTASSMHDDLNEFIQDIASGAVASIMRIPKQPFTSTDHAIHEAIFRDRIKTVTSKVGRSFMATRIRGSANFL